MSKNNKKSIGAMIIFKRLTPYITPYIPRLSVGLICGILQGGSTAGMILVLNYVLQGMSSKRLDISNMPSFINNPPEGYTGDVDIYRIIITALLLPIVALIQGILLFIGRYFVEWSGSKVITDLRQNLFEHIHSLPLNFFSRSRSGNLITRLTSDIGLLMSLITHTFADILREPFTLIGCIIAMIILDEQLSIITLIILPVCLLPVIIIGKRVRLASRKGQESMSDMLSIAQESFENAIVIKAFQTEKKEINNFKAANIKAFKMSMRQLRARASAEPILYLFASLSVSIVVIYSYVNNLSLALLMSFLAATIQMYKPLKKLSQVHLRVELAAPGAERVFSILDIKNTIIEKENPVEIDIVKSIFFKNVYFSYKENKVLSNINLNINAGEQVAFVGSSGAGKTTLLNLVPRFFDVNSGCIKINDFDIRDYKISSIRKNIGVVTQDTILFNRSVYDNISYGCFNFSNDDIILAAKRANAHDFITNLDDGYDTVIGERASLLSGGMAQRISIARAILKNPPILILDEATSSLDSESEKLVQSALDELMKNRTVLIIAHRLSTILNADKIIVLEEGKIIEEGNHKELINQNGRYKNIYDLQFQKKSN